jgi:pimeloyl-ACP methyl ester carboxylesterase
MAASFVSYVQRMLYSLTQLPSSLITYFKGYYSRVFATIVDRLSESALVVTGTTAECRYRLDNNSSATLSLPDGRKLGYAQYGLQTGHAILYLHGLPGSRIEAAFLDTIAVRLEARIIAVDRPGYGWSSPHPNRTILDQVKDVEHLAEQLELDTYAVLGISGGGPYALACAAYLPADKLKAVSIVCGLGPPDIGNWGMNWGNWLGFTLGYRYTPGLVHWWFEREAAARLDLTDEERLELLQRQFSKSKAHPKDVAVYSDVDRMRLWLRSARESYSQGFDGLAQDGHLVSMDFGFRIEDIRSNLPVQLWYGKLDTSVPLNHGEQIAARLGSRAHLRREDETHATIVTNWEEQILEHLVRAM